MTFMPWLRRHPVGGYCALTYGISWGGIPIVVSAAGFNMEYVADGAYSWGS
jgi:hypothetical protein